MDARLFRCDELYLLGVQIDQNNMAVNAVVRISYRYQRQLCAVRRNFEPFRI